jgi:hypothetical protein
LQQVTTFGDEQIIEAQALIGAFVGEEEAIAAATKATIDLAAAKGMDLVVAADLVSKTLGSSTNALSRYGIQVEGAVGSTDRLESLTSNLANVFGGQATAQAQTLDGQIKQFNNSLGDLGEQIGEIFMPILLDTVKGWGDLVSSISGYIKVNPSDNMRTELDLFNSQLDLLKKINPQSSLRKTLIQEIKKEYPEYLSGLDLEKATVEEINKFQKQNNELSLARIIIASREEEILEVVEKREKLGKQIAKNFRDIERARKGDSDAVFDYMKTNAALNLEITALTKLIEIQKEEFKELGKELENLQTTESDYIKEAQALIDAYDKKNESTDEATTATDNAIEATKGWNVEQIKSLAILDNWNMLLAGTRTELEQFGDLNIEAPSFLEDIVMQEGVEEQLTAIQELAHQHQFLADTIDSGDEFYMKWTAISKVMTASMKVQMKELKKFEKGHVNAAMAVGAAQMHVGQAAADAAGLFIAAKTQEAIAAFIADAFKKFGLLGGIIGAGASGIVGSLFSQGIKSVAAAEGMNEVVSEPTLILAGEEGAEYVNIEPTQNEGAGMGGGSQIVFQGNVLSDRFIEEEAIPKIRDAIRRGHNIA